MRRRSPGVFENSVLLSTSQGITARRGFYVGDWADNETLDVSLEQFTTQDNFINRFQQSRPKFPNPRVSAIRAKMSAPFSGQGSV